MFFKNHLLRELMSEIRINFSIAISNNFQIYFLIKRHFSQLTFELTLDILHC